MLESGLYYDPFNAEQKSQLNLYQALQSNRKGFYFDFKRKAQSIYRNAYQDVYDSIGANPRLDLLRAGRDASKIVEDEFNGLFKDFHVSTGLYFAENAYNSSRHYKDKITDFRVIESSTGKVINTDRFFINISDSFVVVNGKRRNIKTTDTNKIILTERISVNQGDTGAILTKGLSDTIKQIIRNTLTAYAIGTLAGKLAGVRQTTIDLFTPSKISDVDVDNADEVRQYIDKLIRRNARDRAAMSAITETTQASNHGLQLGARQVSSSASKIWVSRMDDRVRETHGPLLQDQDGQVLLGADGLEVPIGQPYVIRNSKGGFDRLNFPSDTSLGASLGNIINCRCYEQFKL